MSKKIFKIFIISIFTILGAAAGFLVFFPGVIFETPDQMSMFTLLTFPVGTMVGWMIGMILTRAIFKDEKAKNNQK